MSKTKPTSKFVSKLVFVGDESSQKLALMSNYANEDKVRDEWMTVFSGFEKKIIFQDEPYFLSLNDTSPKDDYSKLRSLCYFGTSVFLICFSVHDVTSFQNVKNKWYKELQEKNSKVPFIIVGTRDRDKSIAVTAEEAQKLAKQLKAASYYEVNIFTNAGMHGLFENCLIIHLKSASKEIKKIEIDPSFNGYSINFFSVFTNHDMKEYFQRFLGTESNSEPFEFLLKCKKLDQTNDFTLFKEIVTTFIIQKSKKEINIAGKDRTAIIDVYTKTKGLGIWNESRKPSEFLFNAKQTIIADLKYDSFGRFIYSKLGYEAIIKNINDENVIVRNPYDIILKKLENIFDNSFEIDICDFAKILSSKIYFNIILFYKR